MLVMENEGWVCNRSRYPDEIYTFYVVTRMNAMAHGLVHIYTCPPQDPTVSNMPRLSFAQHSLHVIRSLV
jgi:hypothetical protein